MVWSQPRQIVGETLSLKNLSQKRADWVAEVVEHLPSKHETRYHQKKKKKKEWKKEKKIPTIRIAKYTCFSFLTHIVKHFLCFLVLSSLLLTFSVWDRLICFDFCCILPPPHFLWGIGQYWGLNSSKHSVTWATPLALLFIFCFWDRVLLILSGPQTHDPLALASQVAEITCVYHHAHFVSPTFNRLGYLPALYCLTAV
jgi:hypothetical protein